jgi:DNA-binding transcriptional ArsR family regulator
MLQYQGKPLDSAFHALSDPGRRAMVERLCLGPASVTELADPLPMTLSAVVQHLKVLQDAALVKSEKVGRVRTFTLEMRTMDRVADWIDERKRFWHRQYDQLDAYLAQTAPRKKKKP